jgi:NAD(P)-dependent dehydrogenase (short-subunit alcohol dehydrogenase family)
MTSLFDLTGRLAPVTGSGKGIGLHLTERLVDFVDGQVVAGDGGPTAVI